MCRYAMYGPYRDHCVCFACRKSFKWPRDRSAATKEQHSPKCPQCRGPLERMGLDFKAPKTDDVRQWEKVRVLAAHGYKYYSCGCDGPGIRPKELRDVAAFLADRLPASDGEALLRQIEARAAAHHRNFPGDR